ncbi:DUF481 domain-containing protein [Carnimonas nigrificans]|uniref:DUF481 domain-containing protein n=1 Tax=Carnimonas nigrificans TaxID=64323 RepID=UPI000472661C|nr:DUF481 domain-containing protein [Carnimonas nigrificans]
MTRSSDHATKAPGPSRCRRSAFRARLAPGLLLLLSGSLHSEAWGDIIRDYDIPTGSGANSGTYNGNYSPIADFSTFVPPQNSDELFKGSVQFGLTAASGNDTTHTLNGRADLNWYNRPWSYNLYAYAYNSANKNETTAEHYVGAARTRYDLNDDSYLFSQLRLTVDRFSGYSNQLALAGGYGRQLLKSEHQNLSIDMGPGIRRDVLRYGPTKYRALGYLGFDYTYAFTETASFEQRASAEAAGNGVTMRTESSLKLGMSEKLNLRLAYLINYTTNPPPNAQYTTDTTTLINLEYAL